MTRCVLDKSKQKLGEWFYESNFIRINALARYILHVSVYVKDVCGCRCVAASSYRGPPLWNGPRGERRLAADLSSAVRQLITSL